MPTPPPMPNYVAGLRAAGAEVLRAIAGSFAPWQLQAPVDTGLHDAAALAGEYLRKLRHPEHVFDALPPDAQDRVAQAVGCPRRADWVSPPVPEGTPSYRLPSWEAEVYGVLFLRRQPPRPTPRPASGPHAPHAPDWPELSGLHDGGAPLDGDALAHALVRSLGPGWEPASPAGALRLPRVRFEALGLHLVAIPGGLLTMGLSPAEDADLKGRLKGRGPEAAEHLKALRRLARPVRTVQVPPFLCAEAPLPAALAKLHPVGGEASAPHDLWLLDSEEVAAAVARTGLRLLSEAEWEWAARAGGRQAWLCGEERPEVWAAQTLALPLDPAPQPFGLAGLGWPEWVDDGWHPSHKGAPPDASPWGPMDRPELLRGGALALWPWQVGGELLLLHAAARERASDGGRGVVRLARGLPARVG